MKTNKYTLIGLLFSLFLSGCDSFLDPAKDGKLDEEAIWKDTRRSFGFLNNAYNFLPNGYNRIGDAMLASGCDEAVHSDVTGSIRGFNDGTWGPYSLVEDVWSKNYEGIRIVNHWLEKADDIVMPTKPTISGTNDELLRTRERMKGEARFLRAYFYFELIKRYGGVPLMTRRLTMDEAKGVVRASFDDCMEQIVADCDSAVKRLPQKYDGIKGEEGFSDATQLGRATVGAAYALKSRALLYWASPLNNPNNDPIRYQKAAEAALKALGTKMKYQLKPFAAGESFTDLYAVSSNFKQYHDEIIFSTKYAAENEFERDNALLTMGGRGYTGPTQNLADAFGMANGKPMSEADKKQPYKGRDPRFDMTFVYNNMKVKMNGRTETVETFEGGKDAVGSYKTATRTGYYLNKLMSDEVVWDGSTNQVTRTWVLIRTAELFLNYAEAQNEFLSAPDESVYEKLEAIRKRAGLTPYTLQRGMTKDEMRKVIHRERQIELAFEEHRFFDIRRWRLFDDAQEREKLLNIQGIRIQHTEEGEKYETYTVERRVFEDKMYRYPISQNELLKAPGMKQNEGW